MLGIYYLPVRACCVDSSRQRRKKHCSWRTLAAIERKLDEDGASGTITGPREIISGVDKYYLVRGR